MKEISRAAVLGYIDIVPYELVFDQPNRYVWASRRNGVDYAWRLDPGAVWTLVADADEEPEVIPDFGAV